MILTICGLFLRPINYLVPVKKKHWIFGSDMGNMYREGSKYLIEYMLKYHTDYDCTFITRNREVVDELKKKGIPVAHNYSLKGLYKILIADCVFTTQVTSDIFFAYPKKGRSLFYLVHGQPFKYALGMLSEAKMDSFYGKSQGFIARICRKAKGKIGTYLTVGYGLDEISFVSATSPFTASLMRKEFKPNVDVLVLGMPRNDALFHKEWMVSEKWIPGTEGKRIVTYMPTHRKYGRGLSSPIPFANNMEVQEWMRENNVTLLIKQHPNMISAYKESDNNDVIIDISKARLDPQVVIYHSDILITDYSSVWMDFLMLRRPLIFYFYDNFEEEDVGTYYNLREEFPNNYCSSETALFEMIKKGLNESNSMLPSEKEVSKFHKYLDDKSCERYYKEITRRKYGEK